MTRRRSAVLLVVLVAATLAVPAVRWRAYGWGRGEAFFDGRPTTYWREAVLARSLTVYPPHRPRDQIALDVVAHRTLVQVATGWANRHTGLFPSAVGPTMVSVYKAGPPAVPVLTALLADPDPRVRGFAASELQCLGRMARPAAPALRRLTADRGVVGGGVTVGQFARAALAEIEADGGP